jgi:hypothetical protein
VNRTQDHMWRAKGHEPFTTTIAFTASGDQAHQSTMQVNPTRVGSQRRRTDAHMMAQHDGTRRKCVAHNLHSIVFTFSEKSMAQCSLTQKMHSS